MSTLPPDPSPVLDLLNAFRTSAALFAGVSLGIFDQLEAGPQDLDSLARKLGTDADALERLLGTLVHLNLLAREGERFATTPTASAYLCRSSPRRLTGYITYSDRVLWNLWGKLADAVREGSHRWKQVYDLDGPIFASFFRTEDEKREFLWGMHGFGQISSPTVVTAFDLSRFRRLVDLGGATGHLVLAACKQYPLLEGVVYDLPAVIPQANEVLAGEPGLASRVSTLAGDFFVDELPSADLYALGRILHDWSPDKIGRLLARIHAALPVSGALLIAEKLLDDDRNGPLWAQLQSLNMLVCTEGKERTRAEYESFLHQAGFARVEVARTGKPVDALLAFKSA